MISSIDAQNLLKSTIHSGQISEIDTAFLIYDLDRVKENYKQLKEAFPNSTLHAIATKALPLPYFLKLQHQFSLGHEAASMEELQLSLKSNVAKERIIYDGPAKTREELIYCIEKGIYLNANGPEELERIDQILSTRPGKIQDVRIGLRINPMTSTGSIPMTSVVGENCKFGVSVHQKDELKQIFQKYPWLKGVHVHIGSQSMKTKDLIEGQHTVFDFIKPIDQIKYYDLGGGLPVVYKQGDEKVSYKEYAKNLSEAVPQLFSGKYQLITEFGRSVYASTAICASKIEYVLRGQQIIIHVGADMFMRRCYRPDLWHHEMSVVSSKGESLNNSAQKYSVHGPLCFAGDILTSDISLPKVNQGDYLLIHDAGAYTLGMWSRHCSRVLPKVLGVTKENGVEIIKTRETVDELFNMWS